MKKALKLIDDYLEESLLVVMMAYFAFVTVFQVLARFVLKISVPWTEETGRYVFIWMTFIGASYAAKKRSHIRIDVIETFIEKKKAVIMKLIAMLIFLIFTIIFFKIGIDICNTLLVRPQKSSVLGISMIYVYAALPTGMILTSLRLIQSLWREYGHKKNKEGRAL